MRIVGLVQLVRAYHSDKSNTDYLTFTDHETGGQFSITAAPGSYDGMHQGDHAEISIVCGSRTFKGNTTLEMLTGDFEKVEFALKRSSQKSS